MTEGRQNPITNQLTHSLHLQTIFEINATAKKTSHAVMRAKREMHDHIIKRAQDNKAPVFLTPQGRDRQDTSQPLSEAEEDALASVTLCLCSTFTLAVTIMDISKVPTVQLKALNKHHLTHIMYGDCFTKSKHIMYTSTQVPT